ADRLPLGDHLRQLMAADGFAERGLRGHADSVFKALHFQNGFFGVPDNPEENGVNTNWDGVPRKRRFGLHVADADTLIDCGADGIDNGDDPEQSWAAHSLETAETE